jgi:hypothetical protein
MKIEVGKTYLTRDGRKARVVCTDMKSTSGRTVVALVLEFEEFECAITVHSNGAVYTAGMHSLDSAC